MRLQEGEFKSILREIRRAKVVIRDEFADPDIWNFQKNNNGAQWAATRSIETKEIFEEIHAGKKTLITAGQHNPFETIDSAGIVGRLHELFGENVIEL